MSAAYTRVADGHASHVRDAPNAREGVRLAPHPAAPAR